MFNRCAVDTRIVCAVALKHISNWKEFHVIMMRFFLFELQCLLRCAQQLASFFINSLDIIFYILGLYIENKKMLLSVENQIVDIDILGSISLSL